jgi:hypothetical protein
MTAIWIALPSSGMAIKGASRIAGFDGPTMDGLLRSKK